MYPGKITDIKGLSVGHWSDYKARTGCTVALFDGGAVAGVDVRGCAPGTRETDLLRGYNLVDRVNAIVLTGGSAFGLSSACGVMKYLEERSTGFASGGFHVPIVPAAVLFDLDVGDGNVRPDAAAGYAACEAAGEECGQGRVGAGAGATVFKLLGSEHMLDGGLGTACVDAGRYKVAALMAVNAAGAVFDCEAGRFAAGFDVSGPMAVQAAGANTTIGIVATDAPLNREQVNKLASIAHDGFAIAIKPAHTPFDGDTVFGAALCQGEARTLGPEELLLLFAAAPVACARAIVNAVAP